MVTISVLLTIAIPETRSLKEKRAVIRSLVERYRSRLHLSAAEVGMQDDVRRAQVGFAVVSGDVATARALADAARRFADEHLIGRGEVIEIAEDEALLE